MKRLFFALWLLNSLALHAAATPESEADKLVDQKSYQKALEIYQTLTPSSPEHQRVLDYKINNAQWRAEAGSSSRDDTKIQKAAAKLAEIANKEPFDRIWAEANESLGDFNWARPDYRNWGGGWPYYQKALDFWAGEPDSTESRQRYLRIIWSATEDKDNYYGYYGNWLPVDILENAVKIAQSPDDQARAHYLLAMSLRNQGGDPRQMRRVPQEFQAAIKLSKKTDWYDDALFYYAQHLEYQGRLIFQNGYPQWQPDLIEALKIYQKITALRGWHQ